MSAHVSRPRGQRHTTQMHSQPKTSDDNPQHGIDVALVQAALRNIQSRIRAHHAKGGGPDTTLNNVMWVWRQLASDLGRRCWATMSAKARAGIERYLGPEEVDRIRRLHWRDETPEVLRVLPKRPPGRMT